MSSDEEMAAIERLVMERSRARREGAFLLHEARELCQNLENTLRRLSCNYDSPQLGHALAGVEGSGLQEAFDRLRQVLDESHAVTLRLVRIGRTLQDAGIE